MDQATRAPRVAVIVAAALFAAAAQAAPTLPAEVTLNEVLGFRTTASLKGAAAIKGHEYLAKGTKVKLLSATPVFGAESSFCKAEAMGHKGYIRCDKPGAFHFAQAPSHQEVAQAPEGSYQESPAQHAAPGKKVKLGSFCNSEESCKTFCEQHCKLDLSKWGKGVSSTCSFPGGLGGSIPDKSKLLRPLPSLKHVKGGSGVQMTIEVVEGLRRLDQVIETSSAWPAGHTAFVKSCWRSDAHDSANECDFVLKGWHVKEKFAKTPPVTAADKAQLANAAHWINPPKYLGLTWPGATPHSAGLGCDIVVRDPAGKELTACKGAKNDTKTQAMSKALVDAITGDKVGAVRLNYEMWHFEWNSAITGCRCKGDDCNNNHWPTLCDGPQHCSKPM